LVNIFQQERQGSQLPIRKQFSKQAASFRRIDALALATYLRQ